MAKEASIDTVWEAEFGSGDLAHVLDSFDEATGVVTLRGENNSYQPATYRFHVADLWRLSAGTASWKGRKRRIPRTSLADQVYGPDVRQVQIQRTSVGNGPERLDRLRASAISPGEALVRLLHAPKWVLEDGVLLPCVDIPVLAQRIVTLEWCRRIIVDQITVATSAMGCADQWYLPDTSYAHFHTLIGTWVPSLRRHQATVEQMIATLTDPALPAGDRRRRLPHQSYGPDGAPTNVRPFIDGCKMIDCEISRIFSEPTVAAAVRLFGYRWSAPQTTEGRRKLSARIHDMHKGAMSPYFAFDPTPHRHFTTAGFDAWRRERPLEMTQVEREMRDFTVATIETIRENRRRRPAGR